MMIKPGSTSEDFEEELESEFEAPRIGSASEDPEPIILSDTSRVGRAHYEGMSEVEAVKTFHEESLCGSCFMSAMCRVAVGVDSSLTVVSRCLAYLPPEG
jgi:hypothetical protein